MSITIDLSDEALDPKATAAFARAHSKSRPTQDILFKVSRRALQEFCGEKPKNAIPVSKDELAKLNESLRGSFTAEQFLKRAIHKCTNCARTFTFFDFYESGSKQHGQGYLSELFSGKGYHIHIQKRDKKLSVICTACGATSVLTPGGYDGPDY